jgi:hypothetical protein
MVETIEMVQDSFLPDKPANEGAMIAISSKTSLINLSQIESSHRLP